MTIKHGTRYAYAQQGCRCESCRKANADSCREYHRRKGMPPQGSPCMANGVVYEKQSDAARALGIDLSTVTYHLNRYGNLDRVGAAPGGGKGGFRKPVSIGQRTWPSRRDLSRYLGCSVDRVSHWITSGKTDALITALMIADTKNLSGEFRPAKAAGAPNSARFGKSSVSAPPNSCDAVA